MKRRSEVVGGDLADKDVASKLIEEVVERFGRLDIVVLNASVEHRHPWDAMPSEDFDAEIDVNLRAPLDADRRGASVTWRRANGDACC